MRQQGRNIDHILDLNNKFKLASFTYFRWKDICRGNLWEKFDGKASIKVFINMINRIRILKLLFKKSFCHFSYINLWTISCFNFNGFNCFIRWQYSEYQHCINL